jgi:ketosteroid isomerase-like protein
MAEHPNFTLTKNVWDKINEGDYSTALDDVRDDVVVDNGPGAGPWRHIEGKDAYVEMMMSFLPLFGDTWKQEGKVVYADDTLTIVLVHETGTHAESGEEFDNMAVWVTRLDADGKAERQWTVDMAHEELEKFWERNPVGS